MYRKVKISNLISVFALKTLLFNAIFLLILHGVVYSNPSQIKEKAGANSNSFTLNIPSVSESSQIFLSSEMIIDEAFGGKDQSVNYLVDEQYCNPENEMHPYSNSWNPYRNTENGPYHVDFDLGAEYHLTKIAFHDLQDSKNLKIEVGEPGNWNLLFTAKGSEFNSWVENEVSVTSRYVRFSMDENVYAAVNEILLYGTSETNDGMLEKSADLPGSGLLDVGSIDFGKGDAEDFSVELNSVYNQLSLVIPDDMAHDFTIEIYNLNGLKVLHREFIHNMSSRILLDVSRECERNGIYILRYYNDYDETKTLKFIKRQ